MKFTAVQMLRFAAAMLVAVMHITQAISVHLTGQGPGHYWAAGSAGVDIFFVISGFVMGITTPPSAATWRARVAQAWVFMQRRLIRVVPLYWFYTLLKVAVLALLPALATRASLDGTHLAASLLFVPWASPWGAMEPVLPVGWTLNFEMLFYLLFALAVLLGLPRLISCLAVFLLFMLAARLQAGVPMLAFWGSEIVLEFVLGVALARMHQRGLSLTPEAGALAMSLGLLWMFALPWTSQDSRVLSWGTGAGLVVAGALWLEPWALRLPVAARLAFLGDASYSIYLSHTFVVPAAARAAAELMPGAGGEMAWVLALLVVLAGCLSYVMLERPMTLSLQHRLMRSPAAADARFKTPDRPAAARPTTHAP